MGQHRQALDIYVFKMKDPSKAEKYVIQSSYRRPNTNFILATAIKYNLQKPLRPYNQLAGIAH